MKAVQADARPTLSLGHIIVLDLDPVAGPMVSRHVMALCFVLACGTALLARRTLLSLLMAYGVVESYTLWRFDFHNWMEEIMEAVFPGRSHFEMQTWFILLSIVPGIIALLLYLRGFWIGSSGYRITSTGAVALLFMIAVELISRDDIIRIFYQNAGPLPIFTWWIAGATLIIAIGNLVSARRSTLS